MNIRELQEVIGNDRPFATRAEEFRGGGKQVEE